MAVVIAFALIAMLVLMLPGDMNPGSLMGQNSAGTINGDKMDFNALNRKVNTYTNDFAFQNGLSVNDLDDATRESLKIEAWNDTVQQMLKAYEYEKLGLEIASEEEGELFIGANPHPLAQQFFGLFMENYNPTQAKQIAGNLEQYTAQNPQILTFWNYVLRTVPKDYKDAKYSEMISGAVYAPSWEVEAYNAGQNKRVNVEFLRIPYDDFSDSDYSVTDNEIANYIKSQGSKFEVEANRSLEYVTFDIIATSEDSAQIKSSFMEDYEKFATEEGDVSFLDAFSDTDPNNTYQTLTELENPALDSFFTKNVGYTTPPKIVENSWVSTKLLDRINVPDSVKMKIMIVTGAGKNFNSQDEVNDFIDSVKTATLGEGAQPFDSIAMKLSDDNQTAPLGGDLGYIKKGNLAARYGSADLQALEDSIFYNAEIGDKDMLYTSVGVIFYEIDDLVRTTPALKIGSLTKLIEYSSETSRSIFTQANSFAAKNRSYEDFTSAANEAGKTIYTEDIQGQTIRMANLVAVDGVSELIGWAFKQKINEVSSSIPVGDQIVVAAVVGATDKGLASVEDVRFEVQSELLKDKKAADIIGQINGNDLSGIASQFSVEVESAEELTFGNTTISGFGNEPKVVAAACALGQNQISKPIAGDNGVYLVKVLEFYESEVTDANAVKQTVMLQNQSNAKSGLFQSMVKAADVEDSRHLFY